MRICVITVHNSSNCGSFLQAYALKKVLEKEGHDVSFLHRQMPRSIRYCIITSIKKVLKLQFDQVMGIWQEYFSFSKANKSFVQIKAEDCSVVDGFVIGSDTIWNFDDHYFAQNKQRYLGLMFPNNRVISYAASIANTSYDTLLSDSETIKGLKKIDAMSVRDGYTKEIVDKITERKSALVLDPTLLLSHEDFAQMEGKSNHKGYILIYMPGTVSEDIKQRLLQIRSLTGKKIISLTTKRSWVDVNVSNDPFKFLYYFNHADMVVTNTFHGTIFSIINHKPFAEFGGHKKKVSELLNMLDLRGQICESAEDMEKILNQKIDYDKVEGKLDVLREQSKEYLFNALKG